MFSSKPGRFSAGARYIIKLCIFYSSLDFSRECETPRNRLLFGNRDGGIVILKGTLVVVASDLVCGFLTRGPYVAKQPIGTQFVRGNSNFGFDAYVRTY